VAGSSFALRYLTFQRERVQRTRGGVEVPLGEMAIDGGFLQVKVGHRFSPYDPTLSLHPHC
jgi:hypothetical protein